MKRGESFEHHHGLIEAARRANMVRDSEVTDPAYGSDVKPYLTDAWLDAEAAKIDRKRAGGTVTLSPPGDTIWMGAIDAEGIAVSFIQSIFFEFGSGLVLPRTGILWQNRGSSFSLDPRSKNPLMPGRKPFHTLNPAAARFNDGRVMAYGSMGGDGQPQFQDTLFTRAARFGMELGDAIDAPRWRAGRTWGRGTSAAPEVVMENRFDPDLVTALERAGHNVVVLGEGLLRWHGARRRRHPPRRWTHLRRRRSACRRRGGGRVASASPAEGGSRYLALATAVALTRHLGPRLRGESGVRCAIVAAYEAKVPPQLLGVCSVNGVPNLSRFLRLLPLAVAGVLVAGQAAAHPHVWVDAKAEVVWDAKGEITAIRHIWQFDPDFTAYATLNLDANNDGKLSEEELGPLAQTNMDALKEYDYFTHLYVAQKKVAFGKPEEYWLDFHNQRLTLFYTLPLAKPLALHGPAMLEVGDPEYFVAISFVKNAEVHLEGAPKGCTAAYKPPHDLDAQTMAILSQVPIDQRDLPPDLVQAASLLSNVINLNCPGGATGAAAPAPTSAVVAAPRPSPANTLSPSDAAIPDPAASAAEAAAQVAQNGPPTIEIPSETKPAPAPPAPKPGFFGWLGQAWHNAFGGK